MPTCPFCYEKFAAEEMPFRCETLDVERCPKENDSKLAEYFLQREKLMPRIFPGNHKKGFFGTKVASEAACPNCNRQSTTKACPNCHNHLPPLLWESESHIISIVGARSSGKSSFITVLIDKLLHEGHQIEITALPQNIGVDPEEVTHKRYEREYKIPLIVNGKELPQTQVMRDFYPLLYQITATSKHWQKKSVIYLAFYDTAGENLQNHDSLLHLVKYLTASSGIILLMDTLEFPSVKEKLHSTAAYAQMRNSSNMDVLNMAIERLQHHAHLLNRKRRIKIPLAIALNKFDQVLRCDQLSSPGIQEIEKDWETTAWKYNGPKIDHLSKVIDDELIGWNERQLVLTLQQHFLTHRRFAVSALGASPKGGKLQDGKVRPGNIWAPLLWILNEIGFSLPK